MKKFNTLLATIALALPIAVTPLAPVSTLIANAAAKKPAAKSYDLTKACALKPAAFHATKTGTLYDINFAADRSVAFVSPVKAKLGTKKTYLATKQIILTSGKKGAKKTTYCLLETTKHKTVGWIKASEVTKGAYVATKAKATTKKTAKATTTTVLVTKKCRVIKGTYTAKKAAPTCKVTFTKKGTARLTKRGTLKANKRYTATKAFYGKTAKRATAHEFVYLAGAGWATRSSLKVAK